ncbi:MAG: glycine cleavage system protein GcvH [Gammaproteobacteria bacterium]
MSNVPETLQYTKDHEWVRQEADGTLVVGITHHAQNQLGELVYVELPEAGRSLQPGEAMAVVESTKAASDVYAPLAGSVLGVNPALTAEPELVNSDPYGAGWLVRLRPAASGPLPGLLDAPAYTALLDADH